ncbi:MAG: DUF1775 domain-containing protein [Bauldia sp.]|nr:DUF1775 domain-containing protein [Bauldia sp.]
MRTRKPPRSLACGLALAGAALASGASAHVELAQDEAPAGSMLRAVFEVEHGCEEAATTALRILVDDRLALAEPQPKRGWTVEEVARDQPQDPGMPHFSREIRWVGGTLPAFDLGEFVLIVQLPPGESGTVIYFPIVQECGAAVLRWIETPLPGEDPESLLEPAPFVTLTGTAPAAHAP